MDKYLLDKNYEKFKSQIIHLDNYAIKKLGIIGNQTVLKINDYHLYCLLIDLGLSKCTVMLILDLGEITYFKKLFDKNHTIHFVFQNSLYKKPISLFIRCKIIDLQVMNPETRHCKVSIHYSSVGNDYKEVLINIFKRIEALRFLHANDKFNIKKINRLAIRKIPLDDSVYFRNENHPEPSKMLIRGLSVTFAKVIGDDFFQVYQINMIVQLEFFIGENSFFIEGTIVKRSESTEIPGFFLIDVKLQFSPYLTDILYVHFKKTEKQ